MWRISELVLMGELRFERVWFSLGVGFVGCSLESWVVENLIWVWGGDGVLFFLLF